MCSGLIGQKCGGGTTCVNASVIFSCQPLGSRCYTCVDAIVAGDNKTAAALHGIFMYSPTGEFLGLLVKRPGDSGLEAFDEITEINGSPANEDFFEKFDKQKGQPMNFNVTVYREGRVGYFTLART